MDHPDIIFIILDTQRADRLGCYGHTAAITPNLDAFARRGVLFEQAIAPAQWTIPSHASMFTGLYPTAHQVTQSSQALGSDTPHLVELLQASGYETVGFCNNPLVGILNNGFRRGFETFYNYGGAIPSIPKSSLDVPWPLNHLLSSYTHLLRRLSYPIQNFFGRSDLAFRISLNAFLTPLWSRFANFKGQNERSVRDVVHFLGERERMEGDRPLFLFLNLMETHLPFWPPRAFIDQVAPYLRGSREALRIMRRWNREAYRWGAPLAEPLADLEQRVLNDLYDAEVAYQDDYLGELFELLQARTNRENTLILIASDHGDGLGNHGYFGHAFVAYQELVHVPLIIQWPQRLVEPGRISEPVSTRRLFHTILDAAGPLANGAKVNTAAIHELSLLQTIRGRDPEQGTAFSEVYPPLNFLRAIERHWPELIEPFRCTSLRRAVVRKDEHGVTFKLIQVDEKPDELFDLTADALELNDLMPQNPPLSELNHQLQRLATLTAVQQEQLAQGDAIKIEDDQLLQRLRGLGYIE